MKMPKSVRDSNFELLRVFAIFLITIHHLVINSIDACGYKTPYSYDVKGVGGVFLNSLAIVGVNVFILISGYYGIKRVWKPIIQLTIDCFIYGCILILICHFIFGYDYSYKILLKGISFTHSWFVVCYFFLVLISPILEYGLKNNEESVIRKWVILLVFANVILGYCFRIVNVSGYSAYNFVMLYVIGRWIRVFSSTYPDSIMINRLRRYGLLSWLFMGVVMVGIFLLSIELGGGEI